MGRERNLDKLQIWKLGESFVRCVSFQCQYLSKVLEQENDVSVTPHSIHSSQDTSPNVDSERTSLPHSSWRRLIPKMAASSVSFYIHQLSECLRLQRAKRRYCIKSRLPDRQARRCDPCIYIPRRLQPLKENRRRWFALSPILHSWDVNQTILHRWGNEEWANLEGSLGVFCRTPAHQRIWWS